MLRRGLLAETRNKKIRHINPYIIMVTRTNRYHPRCKGYSKMHKKKKVHLANILIKKTQHLIPKSHPDIPLLMASSSEMLPNQLQCRTPVLFSVIPPTSLIRIPLPVRTPSSHNCAQLIHDDPVRIKPGNFLHSLAQ